MNDSPKDLISSCGFLALQSESYTVEKFSFLREIKQGKCFDLVCRVTSLNLPLDDLL